MNGKSRVVEESPCVWQLSRCLLISQIAEGKENLASKRKQDWAQKLLLERRNIKMQKAWMYGKLGDGRNCGEENLLSWGGY